MTGHYSYFGDVLSSTTVAELTKYTHIVVNGIVEMQDRPLPDHLYDASTPAKAARVAEITQIANAVESLRQSVLLTFKPYVDPATLSGKLKSFLGIALNDDQRRTIEAVMRAYYTALVQLAKRYEAATGLQLAIPKDDPKLRKEGGLITELFNTVLWGTGLYFGGMILLTVVRGVTARRNEYSDPPRYATRR